MDVPTIALQLRPLSRDELVDVLHHYVYGDLTANSVADARLFEIGEELFKMKEQ